MADAESDEEAEVAVEEEEEDAEDRIGLPFANSVAAQDGGVSENGQTFRFAAHAALLTYSALHLGEFPLLEVYKLISAKSNGGCSELVVCEELHKVPADPARFLHLHVYMWSKNKIDTRNHLFFDLIGNNHRPVHPYMQTLAPGPENRIKVIKYVCKNHKYIMELDPLKPFCFEQAGAKTGWGQLVRDAPTVEAAEAELRLKHPSILYLWGDKILKRKRMEVEASEVVGEGYTKEDFDFTFTPEELKKTILLHGPSGTGKTSLAIAQFEQPLICGALDQLKGFRVGFHDGIVLDDCCLRKLTPAEAIQLVDTTFDRAIQLRYHPAVIPAGTPRIITTNLKWKKVFQRSENKEQRKGLWRRVTRVEVTDQVY